MSKTEHELIVVISNKGYIGEIMESAKKAGAKGGTIIHGKGTATEETVKFLGLTIHPEKEILLIVVQVKDKNNILREISVNHGVGSKARAVSFSLPVIDIVGFNF